LRAVLFVIDITHLTSSLFYFEKVITKGYDLKKILITGGAGYIGSHVVKTLGEKGHQLLIYDNLSKGFKDAVLYGELIVGDLADTTKLHQTVEAFQPDAVMHFASFIEVNESIREPLKYYQNNVSNTINLLDVLVEHHVGNFIFSSSAAVYGTPERTPIPEEEPIKPINPYGQSKAIVERVLNDLSRAKGLKSVSLRYFNAAGADTKGRIGERHNPESHLIPLILKTAKGASESIKIYGNDYPTRDGTCIRDYVHVEDLADAHLLSLQYLLEDGKSDVFNCGYGHGYSVREVVTTASQLTGKDFAILEVERRAGDPPVLVADSSKLKKKLNWTPRYDDLQYIIKTAWEWEERRA
jgi:UDP-glucose 4-epimerase